MEKNSPPPPPGNPPPPPQGYAPPQQGAPTHKGSDEKFCSECGATIKVKAEVCPKCGVRQQAHAQHHSGVNPPKSRTTFILLGLFLGFFGIHNFYAGYTVKGLIQLALGIVNLFIMVGYIGLAIWAIVEIIVVKVDAQGRPMI